MLKNSQFQAISQTSKLCDARAQSEQGNRIELGLEDHAMSQVMKNSHVHSFGIALVVVLLLTATGLTAGDSKSPQKSPVTSDKPTGTPTAARVKIVLIGTSSDHPYATHMYLHECRVLAICLNQTPGVEAVVVQDWPDPKTLAEANAIVFYSGPAGDIVLDPKHREAFQKKMAEGAGFAAIHWGVATKDKSRGEDYLKTLGGWYHTSHAGQAVQTQELQKVDDKHPICRGWQNYKLREEFYVNLKFHPQAQPLVRVAVTHPKVTARTQVVAWAFNRPDSRKGRSFGTTLGHFHENFGITSFRKLIVNGILWTAHVEIPADGAPVSVATNDLDLPPPTIPVPGKKK